jgi:cytochrome b6-f complex iron-sulfur subunit
MPEPSSPSRRGALGLLAAGLAAAALAAAGAVGVGFLYPVPRRQPRARFVCLRSELRPGEPLELQDDDGRKVLLLLDAAGEPMAISTVCTHLGCSIFYRAADGSFDCPCHAGRFDPAGQPVAGPPERPLTRFPVEVREGKVFVQLSAANA